MFNEFDWSKYKFKALTLEHNLYQSTEHCPFTKDYPDHRKKIADEYKKYRETLASHGYSILWADVVLNGYGRIEDWWVSEDLYEKYKHHKEEDIDCNEVINITFE